MVELIWTQTKYQEPEIKIFKLYFKIIFKYNFFIQNQTLKDPKQECNTIRGERFFKAHVFYRNLRNAARHLNPVGEAYVTPPFLQGWAQGSQILSWIRLT